MLRIQPEHQQSQLFDLILVATVKWLVPLNSVDVIHDSTNGASSLPGPPKGRYARHRVLVFDIYVQTNGLYRGGNGNGGLTLFVIP